ncbi:site-2 protease family protein [Streptomyces mirabilis]|uniref:site-2 protease family protein n=1 Tax=Streptomyces mirabilis TaxID=68239 RepID=UPI00368E6CB7
MDESGGSGQPQSGTDEATERHGEQRASSAPAADGTRPGPERPEHPTGPTPPTAPGTSEAAPSPDRSHDPTDAARGAATHSDRSSGAEDGVEVPGAFSDRAEAPAGSGSSDEADALQGSSDETGSKPTGEPGTGSSAQDASHRSAAGGHPHPDPEHPRALAHSGTGTGTGRAQPPRRGREPGGGLLMGRPFGVPVYVAPSWFLVAALITWVFGGQLDRVLPELGALRYLVSLFFAVAFYASVLVHELAHTVAALRFKLPVRRIQLQFFGGVSEIEKEAETPGREFVLSFVGPLLSLVLSGLFYLAMLAVEPGTVPGVLLAGLMISNLIVAAFNLLPGLPLDGGRMLRAVVWKITGRPMSGTIAAAWVGRALAVSVLIGLPLLTQSGALGATQDNVGGMDTVTDALLAAILAAIIWTGAGNSLRMARLREHLPELRARSLTRRAVPVETSTPLSEALRRANEAGARALVVVDADGEPLSLVREAAIVGVPEHRRPWVAVSGLAQDLTDGMRVSAELAGEALLDTLRATPATEYLVVEDSGEIYGVLSAADVERAFVKAMARPS